MESAEMIGDYIQLHDPDGFKKYRHFGSQSGNVSRLLRVLRDQLLSHQFGDAHRTMEGVLMAFEKIRDLSRKLSLETLLHNAGFYGESLLLFKRMFKKRKKHREEILLDMCLYIAQSGNIEEAYETLYSHISAEPYNSNPLLRGYCGVLQYLLWQKEITKQKSSQNIQQEDVSELADNKEGGSPGESLLAKVYSKQALTHFDILWTMNFTQEDNLGYFLELLVALDQRKDALKVLQKCDSIFPKRISIKRLICTHLRQHSPRKINRRRRYLKSLVKLDDSCEEVLELVQLLLMKERVDYVRCHQLLLCHLDYPVNWDRQLAWELLHKLHISWPELIKDELCG